ncbi:abortive infection family protein [Aestuariivirga litoralis]|uniref:abortive infection family protein n=1 Tax=Aestuariivirga litoralis TaxID=2650924 RepID=UPI0018C68E1C|nr:abortive infection family protein [Aestuariivirga litoralis]MBG1230902.1 abortive infection family protein [Aestuariivirga litoralis]
MQSQFSLFVLKALVDTITGGRAQGYGGSSDEPPIGHYRSLPGIQQFMLGCNIPMPPAIGSRLPAATAALNDAANGANGHELITNAIVTVCDPRGYPRDPEKAAAVREHLNNALEADGFTVTIVNGKALLVARQAGGVIVGNIVTKATTLNFDTVENEIARALVNLTSDPEDAVTAACSLLEAVFRSILIELDLTLPPKKDIDGLWKAVQQPLQLSPGLSGLPTVIEQDMRQVLGGLNTVVSGIGALRTHAGDAHGREKGYQRIEPAIARFAVNAAGTAALFIIETWERLQKRSLPLHHSPTQD